MILDEQILLLDELQALLEKQIEFARQGNINDVEVLSKQAGSVFTKIAQAGILELGEFRERWEQLQKLHRSLCLTIATQKADVAERLSQVRKGKKTLKTYRDNV